MNNHINKHKALRKSFKVSDMHGHHYERGKLVPNKMNPIRSMLLERMRELLRAFHNQPVGEGHESLIVAQRLNQEFLSRSRGKGRKARAF